jgi:phosphate transport system substrate-binding protein
MVLGRLKFLGEYMKKVLMLAITISLITSFAFGANAIHIAGSSTVLPYATMVAENFGETYTNFLTPIVESGGTGAGFKEFCKGNGAETIDIANASRPMKDTEAAECAKNGIQYTEFMFGYDGIVFATTLGNVQINLTPELVRKALAEFVIVDGKIEANPYTNWNQIDSSLPDLAIKMYIPGEKHGTREVFEQKMLEVGCDKDGAKAAGITADQMAKFCVGVRKDGVAVSIDGDYTETLAHLNSEPTAIGVFGLYFYEQNTDKLEVFTVNGVAPSKETVADSSYAVSRPLFFYVKNSHVGSVPGLKEYVEFFLNDQMVGEEGVLVEAGLVPAPEEKLDQERAKVDGLK